MRVLERDEPASGVRRLTLNRPEQRNALDAALILALRSAVHDAEVDDDVRVVVIRGAGTAFCAGADLAAMLDLGRQGEEANLADAKALADLLLAIHECRKPVVALVHGATLGGGVGLACAADIVVASDRAWFKLPEVRLGLVPAMIAPYVVRAIGARQASRYFLSAESIDAAQARVLGLVHEITNADDLEVTGLALAAEIQRGRPGALAECKRLIAGVAYRDIDASIAAETAALIARLRAGNEAQQALAAALASRDRDRARDDRR